jgi:hypothetical protein
MRALSSSPAIRDGRILRKPSRRIKSRAPAARFDGAELLQLAAIARRNNG